MIFSPRSPAGWVYKPAMIILAAGLQEYQGIEWKPVDSSCENKNLIVGLRTLHIIPLTC
jgi:hypothetical protein